jgi:hypothetical protein
VGTPVETITPGPTLDQILADVDSGKGLTADNILDTIHYLAAKYPGS